MQNQPKGRKRAHGTKKLQQRQSPITETRRCEYAEGDERAEHRKKSPNPASLPSQNEAMF